MNLTRTFLFLAILTVSATAASAAGDTWRIVQSTGIVKAGGSGFMPAAVRPDQSLPRDSWVETGETGRVVLVRGAETIALGPNARVQLPSQEVDGNTQVLQTLGSALYQIGKQKKPHFQVDTPYLAAVVKGTTFTVSVGEAASSVDVTEGLVQVASADGSDAEYVSPGFTGIVSKTDRGNVVVVTTQHAPAASPDAPAKSSGTSASDDSNGKNRSVIASAIGETVIDVKDVSGGLANGLDNALANGNGNKVGLVSASTEASESETRGNSANANASSVATVEVATTGVSVDVGNGNGNAGASVDLGASNGNGVGASAGVDLGSSNGNGNGAGVTVDLGVGGGNGNGNGVGVGVGVDLGLGNGNSGNSGDNGNAGGLGLGLGNGNAGGNGKGNNS